MTAADSAAGDPGELGLALHALVIRMWAQGQPVPPPDEPMPADADPAALLDALQPYLDPEPLAALRRGWLAGDDTAADTIAELHDLSEQLVGSLIERGNAHFAQERFRSLAREARLAAELAAAIGQPETAVRCGIAAAKACWRLPDIDATIELYTTAIARAERCDPPPDDALAVCHDNLGLALTAIGREDEAIAHFQRALHRERDPAGTLMIRNNLAAALANIGEYDRAARLHAQNHSALQDAGVTGSPLAVTLDNWAGARAALGDLAGAGALLDRAAAEFAEDDLDGRLINAQSRAGLHRDLGEQAAAAAAFVEAHDLTFRRARGAIDAAHFRRGHQRALARRLPPSDEAWTLLLRGVQLRQDAAWDAAAEQFSAAAERAAAGGDHQLALRALANLAATHGEAQRITEALRLCEQVRAAAGERGLSRPPMMVLGTLTALAQGGADRPDGQGVLTLAVETLLMSELDAEITGSAAATDDGPERMITPTTHVPEAKLGVAAQNHFADELAVAYYRAAIATARANGNRVGELNTSVGLLGVLARGGEPFPAEAEQLIAGLAEAVRQPEVSGPVEIVLHRALSGHLAGRDPAAALRHSRRAAELLEGLRDRRPPGPGRADLDREYGVYPGLVRRLLHAGATEEAWVVLQRLRARRLLETLTARAGTTDPYRPPDVAEAQRLLTQVGPATTLLDVILVDDGLVGFLVDAAGVRTVRVAGNPDAILRTQWGDVDARAVHALELVTGDPLVAGLAEAVDAALGPGRSVLLSVDDELANLPLHIAPLHGGHWCDAVAISRLPAIGVLRFSAPDRKWAGRTLIAGDSAGDLPYAAQECARVAAVLGTTELAGPACTVAAVRDRLLGGDLDVVHLAVHGRGDARRGGRASLLFADGTGGTAWTPFDELARLPWRADLIVFSGCSTAVGGPRHGAGLYGVAQAAAEAGASCVVASLWPVDDRSAATFMIAFYTELARLIRDGGVIDLSAVLDHARTTLRAAAVAGPERWAAAPIRRRDGRQFSLDEDPDDRRPEPAIAEQLRWAPFVLLGDPRLVG